MKSNKPVVALNHFLLVLVAGVLIVMSRRIKISNAAKGLLVFSKRQSLVRISSYAVYAAQNS